MKGGMTKKATMTLRRFLQYIDLRHRLQQRLAVKKQRAFVDGLTWQQYMLPPCDSGY